MTDSCVRCETLRKVDIALGMSESPRMVSPTLPRLVCVPLIPTQAGGARAFSGVSGLAPDTPSRHAHFLRLWH